MGSVRDLELLVQSGHGVIAVDTSEEERLETVLDRVATDLRVPFHVWTVTEGLRRVGDGSPFARPPTVTEDSQTAVKGLAAVAATPGAGIFLMKDLGRYLDQVQVVRTLRDLAPGLGREHRVVVLLAAAADLPPALQGVAGTFVLDVPGRDELAAIARRVIATLKQQSVRVGLAPADLERVVDRLHGFTALEAERALRRAAVADRALTIEDLDLFVQIRRELLRHEGVLEYVAPEENLGEVGGFATLKAWLAKRRRAFEPAAREFGIAPPKGILLLGVMGCGKTLVARAVARDWALPLLKMEAGRLYDKFIGESEKNLEKALRAAEGLAPCVLLIDEIEKAFASTSSDADAGLARRIFGRLLGWLQDRKAPVFVVATSNDIGQLPPELTRKGRFDELFFIDLPTREERKEILAVHLAKRRRTPGLFALDHLAMAAHGFSGAELEQVVVASLYTAYARGVEVTSTILAEELRATRPLSVTRAEEVAALRDWARERCVWASPPEPDAAT
jgi:SpoVK/Ycf46/Vps4 family AAA+-type ATPase